jgi:ribose transport system substrate-binding protein
MKRKSLSIILCLLLVMTMLTGCGGGAKDASGDDSSAGGDKIKIGVSIWSSTDTLGSQCKRIIDAAADALGVEVMYVARHVSEQVQLP